ncbi:MAG: hypothetical protein P4L67_05465 [Candidatus Pacebacteria bacterium]|nr:hypothetical protein [Candidatus Paceibacterota bacterium]
MAQEGAEKAAKKEGFDKQVFAPEKAVDLGVLGKSKKRATDETRRVENADGGAKANSGNEGETKKEGGEKKAKTKEEEEHK